MGDHGDIFDSARPDNPTEPVSEQVETHDCYLLLPIGIPDSSPWTCECGQEWFYASGPNEGDWFKAPSESEFPHA